MRVNSRWLAVLLLLAVIPLSGCGFIQKLNARNYLNKGVKAFNDQKHDAAAQFFQKSLEMDPEFEIARMYLATAYMSQFVPDSSDPRSEQMANKAIETFKQIVADAKDPSHPNMNAMLSIINLYSKMKKISEAKEWCDKVLAIDPSNSEASYRVAVMEYNEVSDKTGLQAKNVSKMKEDEKAELQSRIDVGLEYIAKALASRPDYADAMEYQNLLWREKAKLETNEAVKEELILQADAAWLESVKLRRKAQEADAKKPKTLGKSS